MTYRESQIKDLQKLIDQYLLGHYKINHAKMKHPEPNGRIDDIEWFELLEFTDSSYKKQTQGTMSTPTWEGFQSEIISMLALQLEPQFETNQILAI